MNTDLAPLVWVSALTGLLWVPYVLNRIMVGGIAETVGYPAEPTPLSPWAQRWRSAHANAVENLVVFASLALAAHALGADKAGLAAAGWLYFWSRTAHVVFYVLRLSWLRTIAFAGGFAAQAMVAWMLVS